MRQGAERSTNVCSNWLSLNEARRLAEGREPGLERSAAFEDVSTNPTTSRKFTGVDDGEPIRIRVEKGHPDDPAYTGPSDPLHTVDHLHVERRTCVGHIGLSIEGFWDEVVIADADVVEFHPFLDRCLTSLAERLGDDLPATGSPARDGRQFSTLVVTLDDGARILCSAARFEIAREADQVISSR